MASTITAGNATNGLALSCDNTGILELKTGTGSGTTAITADASQNVTVAGTLTAPSVIPSSSTAPTNGVFLPAANTLGFSTASTERARIDSSGNLLVGSSTSPATARVYAKGVSATSSDFASLTQNSAGTDLAYVRNDGLFSTGTAGQSPYNKTTASAANVFVDSGGVLNRSTSSLKYKKDVADAAHGLAEVMQLRAVTYKGKSEEDGDRIFGGLIAEEVHEAGLTEFVQYAEDESPDALAYGNMVSLCIKAIQEQQQMIEELKAEVAALKGAA